MPQLRSLGWEAVHLHPDRLLYSIGSLAKTTAMYYSGQHLEVETKYQARLDPLLLSRSPSEVLLGRAKSDISWKEAGNRPHILWQHSTIATCFLSIVASPVSRHHRPLAAGGDWSLPAATDFFGNPAYLGSTNATRDGFGLRSMIGGRLQLQLYLSSGIPVSMENDQNRKNECTQRESSHTVLVRRVKGPTM
jgi:hypothetical protein